jgi:hypothetical protein
VLLIGGIIWAVNSNGGPNEAVGPIMIIVGVLTMLITLIVGVRMTRVLWPKKIDKNYAWLNGACLPYLDLFPPIGMTRF